MLNESLKLSNIKLVLLSFVFIVMFAFTYFLVYAPIKVNDTQLLTISMFFSAFIVSIPFYIFTNQNEKKVVKSQEVEIKKVSKKSKKKSKKRH